MKSQSVAQIASSRRMQMYLKIAKCNLQQQRPNFSYPDFTHPNLRRLGTKTLESGDRFFSRAGGRKANKAQQASLPKLPPNPLHADPELACFVDDVLGNTGTRCRDETLR